MFCGARVKKVRLTQRERTLIRNALNCQATVLSESLVHGPSYSAISASVDMRVLAKKIPW